MQKLTVIDQITPNKNALYNQCFESETTESSKKDIHSSNSINEKIFKKSIEFFPKKMLIEGLDNSDYIQRKYTKEDEINIKNFVPQLRPIEVHIVPSKFSLNSNGFKDLKRKKNNKISLNSKKYFISCPNSEEEDFDVDDSERFNSSKDILPISKKKNEIFVKEFMLEDIQNLGIDIKETRRNLQKAKNINIPKIHSKNEIIIKGKYEKDLDLDNSFESDLYDIDEIDNYSLMEYEDKEEKKIEKKESTEKNIINRSRTNSFTILEMLRKKSTLEEE